MLGESMRRRRGPKKRKPVKPYRGPRPRRGRWIVAAVVAMGAMFGIGYLVADFWLFPAPPDAADRIDVPDLTGHDSAGAAALLEQKGLRLGAVTHIPWNDDDGLVIAQSALSGQQLRPGAAVGVGVARQPRQSTVPPVLGLDEDAAGAVLGAAGLSVDRRSRSSSRPAGTVLDASPEPGSPVSLPGTVILTVSEGPPQDTTGFAVPDSGGPFVPDTVPSAGAGPNE